jgi:hypothetical protein
MSAGHQSPALEEFLALVILKLSKKSWPGSYSKAAAQVTGQDKEDESSTPEADHEALLEYDNLETKLLTKLGDLSAAKAEEHSDITIAKIKNQLAVMKKAAAKAAKQKAA